MEPNHQSERFIDAILAVQRRERDNDQEYRREISALSSKLLDMYVTKHYFWASLLGLAVLNFMVTILVMLLKKL